MIDFLAWEPQFADHLAPIYLALPNDLRGDFMVHRSVAQRAAEWGITPTDAGDRSRPIVVASYGDQRRARKLGRRTIARLEHGAGQSYFGDPRFGGNASYSGGRDCHDVGLFLCPNETSAERWHDAYPAAEVAVVGCPKLDYLPSKDPHEPLTVAVSFHFDINVIPETRSAFPAFRGVLPALAERFRVIAHAHPKGVDLMLRPYVRMGLEVVTDFAEVCRRADVYCVDNSSTLFEFASTGRPVVVLNDPGFRREVQHGLRFWDAAHVGVNANGPAELLPAVERALLDAEEQQEAREAALRIVYAHRSGGAERAAQAIMTWTGLGVEVAA